MNPGVPALRPGINHRGRGAICLRIRRPRSAAAGGSRHNSRPGPRRTAPMDIEYTPAVAPGPGENPPPSRVRAGSSEARCVRPN